MRPPPPLPSPALPPQAGSQHEFKGFFTREGTKEFLFSMPRFMRDE